MDKIELKVTPRRGSPDFYSFGEVSAAEAYAAELKFTDDMRDFKTISKVELVINDEITKRL